MIIFLTLCYVGLLAILVKVGVVKLTLFWKLSPLLWLVILLVALFLPMQWGAPSGPTNSYHSVVEIIPNVSGEVVDVAVDGIDPLKKGDELFRIDPYPFEQEVLRLEAAIKDAEQLAQMLPANLLEAKAAVSAAEAALVDAKQEPETLLADVNAAEASVAKSKADLNLARVELSRAETLLTREAVTQEEVDRRTAEVEVQVATVAEAESRLVQTRLAYEAEVGGTNTSVVRAEEQLKAARAGEAKAQYALDSQIDGENTTVLQLRAQLKKAKFDLEQTTVRAPADGYVVGVTLRKGQRVANLPLRSWMAFVPNEDTRIVVGVNQYAIRHIEAGQKAEVILKVFPGQTFDAEVEKLAYFTPQGQLQPSGVIPLAPTGDQSALPIGVVLKLSQPIEDLPQIPGGAVGTAAIYTDRAKATHVIRRVMIRMQTYTNYFLP